ncbi:RICIN domain-containing protein [Streptomyces sp. NPDC002845]
MKAPRRVLTAGLCTLAVSGTMLAASSAAPAATANSAKAAAPAPLFRAKLMANHSGKCLDVANANQLDGAFVQQWECYDAPDNQTWNFVAVGDSDLGDGFLADGYYAIRADHSGKCLDVAGASIADGGTVHQWTCDSKKTNQQWRLVQRPNGYFSLIARHSGKCLEVAAGSQANGAAMVQQTCADDRPYQEWKLL